MTAAASSPSSPRPEPPLLQGVLQGRAAARPPLWLMRQAGRYLPEYRALRAEGGSFLDLCLTPDLAVEATLQPLRRFPLDAAILFSDILTVPHALGQPVRFEEGRGPILDPIRDAGALDGLRAEAVGERLAPVYQAVRRLRAELPPAVTLIGFAGAPWTVASYMIEGGASRDYAAVKAWAFGDPQGFGRLIDLLVETTAAHLIAQARAGAQALQLFDSWLGILPEREMRRWGLEPARRIVERVKAAVPDVPLILFPRGAGLLLGGYASRSGADALGLDTAVPLDWAAEFLQSRCVVQGNLDPVLLVVGGAPMRQAAQKILERLGPRRFVFNLGHGVLPQTPPDNVAALCEIVRGWSG
jgi:uroporphyrinogen decarboxylase